MPREFHFDPLGQQTLATTLTASRKGGASAFRAHAGAKTMLLFPCPFRSLQGAFHKDVPAAGAEEVPILGTRAALSTPPQLHCHRRMNME